MKRSAGLAGCGGLLALTACCLYLYAAPQQTSPTPPQAASTSKNQPDVRAVLDKYCVACHNAKLKTAGLALDTIDPSHPETHAETWEKVARKLRTAEMPPPGLPRPDRVTYTQTASALETSIDATAAAKPNPGRVAVHRLNRVEYAAAIHDLLGLDIDARELLPAADSDQEGFDNVASVLTVSPLLLENYLSAAHLLSRLAVNDSTIDPV